MLGGLCVLLANGVLDDADFKKILGNSAPLKIGAMLILGEALTRTTAIAWIAQRFERWAGKSTSWAFVILALIVMPLSAFMNNTPVVIGYCRISGLKTSKLLMPLSFLSILGETTTLIGTSTHQLVAGLAIKGRQRPFGTSWKSSKIGLPVVFGKARAAS